MTDKVKASFKDYDTIRYPLMTEKSTKLLESSNSYVFVVDKMATKPEIKQAVQRVFGVKVKSVNTILMRGKNKIFRGKPGKRADFKKAIVRLESREKIDLGVGV
ncbi:MAG: 50S ribosomal protein L23 [Holosporales bacterium]|jgi:large subunit ribosomal protein L23|nr:50S ribosomal protein L23 [Holosporales bacterium]